MNNYCHIKRIGFYFLISLIIISCKHNDKHEYHSVTDKIEAESKHYKDISISSEKFLQNIKLIKITENNITFLIPDRKDQIKSFACSACHSKPLAQMQNKDIKRAHWNITLDHANKATMNCVTCHNSNDMNYLQSLTGNQIDINKSYKLCSQCHQKEFKDWTGGAHGKVIESWASPRASRTCVNCHNPHSPSFETKWPERYNTRKIKERK